MDQNNDSFTKVLLILSTVAGAIMMVLGFAQPNSIYKHVCGAVCAVCIFFLLGNADTGEDRAKVVFLRILAVLWALYSVYNFATALY